jgi:hypothetical protein
LACSSVWFETWHFTLREEHGLRVFENGVPVRIFAPKPQEDGKIALWGAA